MNTCKAKNGLAEAILLGLTAWLWAAALEYLYLPKEVRPLASLAGLAGMSPLRLLLTAAVLMVLLNVAFKYLLDRHLERWLLADAFGLYAASAVINSFSWAFFGVCALVLVILADFAKNGWDDSLPQANPQKENLLFPILTGAAAVGFFYLVSSWTVARYRSFCTSTFDFGIFCQMFHSMKTTGLPLTTLERDGLLSHLAVHVSPIYYLMLPFYLLVPRPETLQILQAAVLASAVIPLWKLGKQHGLHPGLRTTLCVLLLLYPAYAGGSGYDLHENCFLPPLLLWLLYGIDKKSIPVTAVSALLTLMVKEDAPVYTAVIGVYLLLRSLLRRDKWGIAAGGVLTAGSVAYFLAATAWLSSSGDGVMNYRYDNFMYDGSGSLFTVIKVVLLCPMKAVFECVDTEKLKFIGLTMIPLLGLPLMTRRYERYLLLIPYLLVNLMSDYPYQHDILYQYGFGPSACLFYLVVVNLADLKPNWKKTALVSLMLCISFSCFYEQVLPTARKYPEYCREYADFYEDQRAILDTVPEDADLAATTFYTPYLSRRNHLYDVRYSTPENILSCEYVVLKLSDAGSYKNFAVDGQNGLENLVSMLLDNGYVLENSIDGITEIYRKR